MVMVGGQGKGTERAAALKRAAGMEKAAKDTSQSAGLTNARIQAVLFLVTKKRLKPVSGHVLVCALDLLPGGVELLEAMHETYKEFYSPERGIHKPKEMVSQS